MLPIVLIGVLLLTSPTLAQVTRDNSDIADALGLGKNTDLREIILNLIAYALTFLGLAAVIVILYGGFQWMTAAGNEEQVSSARRTLSAGIIGLVIILSAYAITQFVINTTVDQITSEASPS